MSEDAGLAAKLHRWRWVNMFALFLTCTVGYAIQLAAFPLAPLIREELGISALEITGYTTAFFMSYAIFGIIAGIIADKVGAKPATITGDLLAAIGAFTFGLAPSYWIQLVAYFLFGIACAFVWNPPPKIINAWAGPREVSLQIAIWSSGIPIASVITNLGGPPLAVLYGLNWRIVYYILGGSALIIAGIAYVLIKEAPPKPAAAEGRSTSIGNPAILSKNRAATLRCVYCNPWVYIIAGVLVGNLTMSWILLTYGPIYSTTILPLVMAGQLSSAIGMAGIPTRIAAGWITDRIGRKSPLMIIGSLFAASTVLLAFAGGTGNFALIAVTYFVVGSYAISVAPQLALLAHAPRLPPEKIGTAMGLQSAITFGCSLISLRIAGWMLASGFTWFHVWGMASFWGMLALICSVASMKAERII